MHKQKRKSEKNGKLIFNMYWAISICIVLLLPFIIVIDTGSFLSSYFLYTICLVNLFVSTFLRMHSLNEWLWNKDKTQKSVFKRVYLPKKLGRCLIGYDCVIGITFLHLMLCIVVYLFILLYIVWSFWIVIDCITGNFSLRYELHNYILNKGIVFYLLVVGIPVVVSHLFVMIVYAIKGDKEMRENLSFNHDSCEEDLKQLHKYANELKWQVSLQKDMKKYLSLKYRGELYVRSEDLLKIEKMLTDYYPDAYIVYETVHKKKRALRIYSKNNIMNRNLFFESPIR